MDQIRYSTHTHTDMKTSLTLSLTWALVVVVWEQVVQIVLLLLLGGRGLLVQLADLVHELQVFLLLLQLCDALLALLQLVLSAGQLVPQPLVLLTEPAHLSTQLLLLRLHGAQVTRQSDDHLRAEQRLFSKVH